MKKVLIILAIIVFFILPGYSQTGQQPKQTVSKGKTVNNTKLDDLKNPFDTTKKVKATTSQQARTISNPGSNAQNKTSKNSRGKIDDSLLFIRNPAPGKLSNTGSNNKQQINQQASQKKNGNNSVNQGAPNNQRIIDDTAKKSTLAKPGRVQ
ncbi:MAG TPA: hypothetical protein PKI55_09120 [Chitinophagaceae bacterium]|nr:hypothetical protein [Chitinophagaceae bacterium]